MWSEITAEREDLLRRYMEIMRDMDRRNQLQSLEDGIAQTRSAIGKGGVLAFHYQGQGYDAILRFQYSPKRNRWLICVGFHGAVEPSTVLDLVLEKALEFMREHDLAVLYAIQHAVDFPPLQEFYDLAAADPRLKETVIAELGDGRALELAASAS